MFVCAKLTKLQSTENFDTNPDPDPEWLLICDMCSNTKWIGLMSHLSLA